jgi:hypothetical protein
MINNAITAKRETDTRAVGDVARLIDANSQQKLAETVAG